MIHSDPQKREWTPTGSHGSAKNGRLSASFARLTRQRTQDGSQKVRQTAFVRSARSDLRISRETGRVKSKQSFATAVSPSETVCPGRRYGDERPEGASIPVEKPAWHPEGGWKLPVINADAIPPQTARAVGRSGYAGLTGISTSNEKAVTQLRAAASSILVQAADTGGYGFLRRSLRVRHDIVTVLFRLN